MNADQHPFFFSTWDLLAAAGLAVLAAFYTQVFPLLPDPLPSHFNVHGIADGWTPKTQLRWIIFGVPIAAWLLLFVVGIISSMIPSDTAKAKIAAMHPMRGLLVLGMSILMGICLVIPLLGLTVLYGGVVVMFVCLALTIIFTVLETNKLLAHEPDAVNYRYGVFYVNPDDTRLWVEKRIGVGMTLNYARPAAWWISSLFILIVLIAFTVIFLLSRS